VDSTGCSVRWQECAQRPSQRRRASACRATRISQRTTETRSSYRKNYVRYSARRARINGATNGAKLLVKHGKQGRKHSKQPNHWFLHRPPQPLNHPFYIHRHTPRLDVLKAVLLKR
jgi:hypothetical protein